MKRKRKQLRLSELALKEMQMEHECSLHGVNLKQFEREVMNRVENHFGKTMWTSGRLAPEASPIQYQIHQQ
jgi:hypothetical protein